MFHADTYLKVQLVTSMTELLLNVALFFPVGLIASWALRSWWRGLLVAVLLSALSEAAQIFIPHRHATLVDVGTNATGAVLGSFLYLVLAASTQRRMRPDL